MPYFFKCRVFTALMCVSLAWMLLSVVKEGALTEKYASVIAVPATRDIKGAEQLQHHIVHDGAWF